MKKKSRVAPGGEACQVEKGVAGKEGSLTKARTWKHPADVARCKVQGWTFQVARCVREREETHSMGAGRLR